MGRDRASYSGSDEWRRVWGHLALSLPSQPVWHPPGSWNPLGWALTGPTQQPGHWLTTSPVWHILIPQLLQDWHQSSTQQSPPATQPLVSQPLSLATNLAQHSQLHGQSIALNTWSWSNQYRTALHDGHTGPGAQPSGPPAREVPDILIGITWFKAIHCLNWVLLIFISLLNARYWKPSRTL